MPAGVARAPTLTAAAWLISIAVLAACSSSGVDVEPDSGFRKKGYSEKGEASWYGQPFHGRRTANGEVYDMNGISAAHKKLAFGTRVRVENLDNGADLVVRINDRGPFVRGRIIDLSYGAAKQLGMAEAGVVPVRLTVVGGKESTRASPKAPPEGRSTYRVQVGAFLERENADALLKELKGRHSKMRIHKDDRWYRIQLEGIKDEKAGSSRVRELEAQGYDAFLARCSQETCRR